MKLFLGHKMMTREVQEYANDNMLIRRTSAPLGHKMIRRNWGPL